MKLIPGIIERAKELEKIDWQAKLKGFDANYKIVEVFGEEMKADAVFPRNGSIRRIKRGF